MARMQHILVIIALILVPLAVAIERSNGNLWNGRLLWPGLVPETNRHTPQFINGTFVPPTITESITYSPAQSPVIVAMETTIERGAVMTISPGTTVVFHEHALLRVRGRLEIRGLAPDPVTIASNEAHPENQTWGGIIVDDGGTFSATHATIEQASPIISCLAGSAAEMNSVTIRNTSMGVYTESNRCAIHDSLIDSTRDGIVARGVEPTAINTIIHAPRDISRFR